MAQLTGQSSPKRKTLEITAIGNNNHKLKKRFENPTSISVNYFHSNGIISNTTNTLPSRSSTNNMTANTITIEETYNQQEQRQLHQQDSFEESQEEKKKRRKKEKKREKRLIQHHKKKQPLREQELEGLQFRENHDFETNAMTISENGVTSRNNHNIPTFTVHRREEIA
ncbi:hypothetical protein RRG08_031500 [Elysia crispata]|uniref:Uncharacterized protein n=1 Tax=Elysia crispata TaxID=231223 RepID=A0AAE0XYE7_9GAST|nr:hypothetical protein RRG08_031500 [Elysia crispata]